MNGAEGKNLLKQAKALEVRLRTMLQNLLDPDILTTRVDKQSTLYHACLLNQHYPAPNNSMRDKNTCTEFHKYGTRSDGTTFNVTYDKLSINSQLSSNACVLQRPTTSIRHALRSSYPRTLARPSVSPA